ncbi:hypothetical protein [Cognatilysobacter lacus]|uniref:Transporter n=1 Tax=Cognatilysobacter lacus TaxID=1643323 RepID=A0A5D8Z5M2_9GAMM|nr:hypothetical protein [Lysobacter lacus]TZF90285.1 hypothetical protein FW784_05980 [Lysobacter lacus]
MKTALLACVLLAGLAPGLARADHGEDFLVVDSPGGPTPGELYLVLDGRQSFAHDHATQAGPSLLYGLSDRIALQLDGEYDRARGERWRYAGTASSVQFSLTDPGHAGPQVGLTLSRTFAPDGDSRSEARLGAQVGPDDNLFAANLYVAHESGGSVSGGAVGYRRGFGDHLGLAVEAEGPLQHAEGAQVLASLHFDPDAAWSLKVAVGGDRGAGGYDPFVQARVYVRLNAAR